MAMVRNFIIGSLLSATFVFSLIEVLPLFGADQTMTAVSRERLLVRESIRDREKREELLRDQETFRAMLQDPDQRTELLLHRRFMRQLMQIREMRHELLQNREMMQAMLNNRVMRREMALNRKMVQEMNQSEEVREQMQRHGEFQHGASGSAGKGIGFGQGLRQHGRQN